MGGSHISALKLIGALDRKKYRPLIVLHDDRGQFADFLRAEGVAFEHAPTPWHLAPASRAETIGKMMGAPKALASLAPYLQQDRKSAVTGKRVSVRVDLGGRRLINKKK